MHALNAAAARNLDMRVSFIFISWQRREDKAIRQIGKCGCNVCCLAGLISLAGIIAAALFFAGCLSQ